MLEIKENKLKIDFKVDNKTKRHYFNNNLAVVHCHHYAVLYTQLALDANETELLKEVAEECFYEVLVNYFKENNITNYEDKIKIGVSYFAFMGLGKIEVEYIGENSALINLTRSHVDEGWLKKWGKYDKPVNYIGAGYIVAMLEAINNLPIKSYDIKEVKSIVMGNEKSVFSIVKR